MQTRDKNLKNVNKVFALFKRGLRGLGPDGLTFTPCHQLPYQHFILSINYKFEFVDCGFQKAGRIP